MFSFYKRVLGKCLARMELRCKTNVRLDCVVYAKGKRNAFQYKRSNKIKIRVNFLIKIFIVHKPNPLNISTVFFCVYNPFACSSFSFSSILRMAQSSEHLNTLDWISRSITFDVFYDDTRMLLYFF